MGATGVEQAGPLLPMCNLLRLLLLASLGLVAASAQDPPPDRPRGPNAPNDFEPKGPPRNADADGPWNHDVLAYRVSSGGAVAKVATFERAGVPTIARMKDGRLIVAHQHFPADDRESFDKVAVHFSSDDGATWSGPQVIRVAGLPQGMRFPFDPTLVPLPDGRVRLYFTGNMGRGFGPSTPAIHSAISSDGVSYTYEPGARFAVEGRAVIDCAVALHRGGFHLFAPDNGAGLNPGQRPGDEPAADRPREGVGYHATSPDGLTFTRLNDVQIEGRRRWLGGAQSDGEQITFYGTGEGLSNAVNTGGRPRGGIWMATSADGMSWKLVANPPLSGGDPGAVKTRDGGLLVVITGEAVRRATPENSTPARSGDGTGGGGFRTPLIIALDLNGDGELSTDEVNRAAESLRKLDRDQDGRISRDEWAAPPIQPANRANP